jgi:hypothetical protein
METCRGETLDLRPFIETLFVIFIAHRKELELMDTSGELHH